MAIYELGQISKVTKLSGFEYTKYFSDKSTKGEVPLIQSKNIKGNTIDYSDIFYTTKEISNKLKRSKPCTGDVLLSYVGTIGENYLVKENDDIHLGSNIALISLDRNVMFPKYLIYWINSNSFLSEAKKFTKGAVQQNISMTDLRKFNLVTPSLEEQRAIIDIIEPIELVESNLQKQISTLKTTLIYNYEQLVIQKISINNIIHSNSAKYNNQTYYLATNAIGELSVDYTKKQLINVKRPSRANLTPSDNSILISKLLGENKLLYIDDSFDYVVSTGFFNITTKYVDHVLGFLLSSDFKSQKELYSTGTTMIGLTNTSFNRIEIKTPVSNDNSISKRLCHSLKLLDNLKSIKSKIIDLLIK